MNKKVTAGGGLSGSSKNFMNKIPKNIFGLFFVFSLIVGIFWFSLPVKATSDWLTGWNFRTPIFIGNKTTTLTDFQVNVTLQGTDPSAPNYIDFDKVLTDGADIRFTDSDKTTPLSYWIESWDDTAKTASAWVKVPSIAPTNTKPDYFGFNVDSTAHNNYGLSYPVTYEFDIPASSSGLVAYKRYTNTSSWSQISEKTSNDFFNGIEAVRFDYANNKAYISVAFDADSDVVFLKIIDTNGSQVGNYSKIDTYYDNRKAVVTVSGDDWGDTLNTQFKAAADMFASKQIWFSPGIMTGTERMTVSTWSDIQSKIDAGYIDPCSHSRTHTGAPYADYDSEISGSKTDIIENLDFPSLNKKGSQEYLYCWIEPFGESDATIRQKLGAAGYLIDRSTIDGQNTFATWDSTNGLYTRGYSVRMGTDGTTDLATLNSTFDTVYDAGQIYHLMMHPALVNWSAGQYADQHTSYIAGKKDVWYVGLGHLYVYNYVHDQAITVYPQRIASSGKTIYLYFGNSTASSATDYDNTFTKDFGESGIKALWHMDEDSGNLSDSSGNSNNGTITGATRNATDGGQWGDQSGVVFSSGHSLQFNGTSNYVNAGNSASLNPTSAISIETWVKFDQLGVNQTIVGKGDSSVTGTGYSLFGKSTNVFQMSFYDTSGVQRATNFGSYTTGKWYHVVTTYDGVSYKNYIDGVYINGNHNNNSVSGLKPSTYSLFLGRYAPSSTWFLKGALDEVRIYNRALDADEVLAHYQRRKYVPVSEFSSESYSVLRSNGKYFKGVVNTVSDSDYISYSTDPDINNIVSSDLIITPPSGSASTTITDSSISLDYSNSILTGMIVNNADREIDINNAGVTSLKVNPSSGNLNLTVNTWNTTSDYSKNWTEENTVSAATTDHTIGDLSPNKYYNLTVSGIDATTHILGITSTGVLDPNECQTVSTNRACLSDSSGKIYFRYDGGYSTHTFDMQENTDTVSTPIASPIAGLYNSTQSVTLSAVGSNYIKYSLDSFPTDCSSGINYSGQISVPSTETIYVRACDNAGNSSTQSFVYTIQADEPIEPPKPAKKAYTSSGTSVQIQVSNLLAMGNTKAAEELIKKFPSQFPTQTITPPTSPQTPPITRTLKLKMTGDDVKALQVYLNTHGYTVSTIGAGSPLHETNYFGSLTKKAVISFQKANKLIPDGIVGVMTRGEMN